MSADSGLRLRTKTLLGWGLASLPLAFACSDSDNEKTATEEQAVHVLDIFEIDGDADDDATDGVDWENATSGLNLVAHTSIPIADPGQNTVFTGGGSKDPEDISKWQWKNDGGFPDKDDITNAYAVAYTDPGTGDLIAYFGADRFANDGDAQIGFWFFKNKISLVDPPRANASGTFSGVHAVGDILVLSDFTQGGAQFTIQVLEWVQTGTKAGKPVFGLQTLASGVQPTAPGSNVFCLKDIDNQPPDYTALDDDACATVNHEPTAPFWDYAAKDGSTTIPTNAFYEGGINLSALVPGNTCFSSFLAETRSSQSPTATLKDFVLDDFQTCGISVLKDCGDTQLNEDPATKDDFLFVSTWSAVVSNSGAGNLPDGTVITVQDDNGTPDDDTDDPDPQTCTIGTDPGEAATPEDCVFGGTILTNTNGVTNTVTATAAIGGGTTLTATSSDTCPVKPLNPSLHMCKACTTALAVVEDQVVVGISFSGEVCNNGELPLALEGTDVPENGDSSAIDFDGFDELNDVLEPESCVTFSGTYFPTSSSGVTDPNEAEFHDTVTVEGFHPAFGSEPATSTSSEAICNLCGASDTCEDFPPSGGEGGAGGGGPG